MTETDGLWNTSRFDITKPFDDPDNIAAKRIGPNGSLNV